MNLTFYVIIFTGFSRKCWSSKGTSRALNRTCQCRRGSNHLLSVHLTVLQWYRVPNWLVVAHRHQELLQLSPPLTLWCLTGRFLLLRRQNLHHHRQLYVCKDHFTSVFLENFHYANNIFIHFKYMHLTERNI